MEGQRPQQRETVSEAKKKTRLKEENKIFRDRGRKREREERQQESEVERDAARNSSIKFEETGGWGREASRERGWKEGQNRGDQDVRGWRGDKWRRSVLLDPRGAPPQEDEEMIHSLMENSSAGG